MLMRKAISLASAVAVPNLAMAHTGHGTSDGNSLLHDLSEPLHLIVLLTAALLLLLLRRRPSLRHKAKVPINKQRDA